MVQERPGRVDRRLSAILAADVAGYSRLMGADEEETHERLQAHLRELIEPKIAKHRGRIVKNTGDGFLAEFASVVDAVRCAIEMQRGMAEGVASLLAAFVLLGVTHWLLGQLGRKRWIGFLAGKVGSVTTGRGAWIGVLTCGRLLTFFRPLFFH